LFFEKKKEIYYIKKYGLTSHMKHQNIIEKQEKYLNRLLGKINFVLNIDNNNKEFIQYRQYISKIIKESHY